MRKQGIRPLKSKRIKVLKVFCIRCVIDMMFNTIIKYFSTEKIHSD